MELAPPHPQDRAAWQELIRRSRLFFSGWVNTTGTARAYAAYLGQAADPRAVCRLIRRCDDGALLGAINLTEIVRGSFQSGYLGYYIGAPYAGQGYMTEALQLMLRLAFQKLGLHRIEANVQPGNLASLRLLQRAGFRREGYSPRYLKIAGRWRDHERWAILADEWPSRGKRP